MSSWEPYRCCAEFGLNVASKTTGEIVMLYAAHTTSFFESFGMAIMDPFFINLLSFAFLMLVVFSHVVWLGERRVNHTEFPISYFDGIDDAIWWGFVTFTTVGYGDKVPKSPLGRLVALVWMILGITISCILTGHLADTFSQHRALSRYNSVSDFEGRRVCGYASTFESYYIPSTVTFTQAVGNNMAQCGEMMAAGEVDVVVMEAPTMAYWISHNTWARTQSLVLSDALAKTPIGIIFQRGSPLRAVLDEQFLLADESSFIVDAYNTWFGTVNERASGPVELEMQLVLPAAVLLGTYALIQIARMVPIQSRQRAVRPSVTSDTRAGIYGVGVVGGDIQAKRSPRVE